MSEKLNTTERVIEKSLVVPDKIIRFSHQDKNFNFKKVSTYISIYFDASNLPYKEFFLEKEIVSSSNFDIIIPHRSQKVKLVIATATPLHNLDLINVDFLQ